jgi:hypothetical protein
MKKYRTIIAVIRNTPEGIWINVPEWCWKTAYLLKHDDVPSWISGTSAGFLCFANVNMRAETPAEWDVSDWEY